MRDWLVGGHLGYIGVVWMACIMIIDKMMFVMLLHPAIYFEMSCPLVPCHQMGGMLIYRPSRIR
jgi:hypothetical protein